MWLRMRFDIGWRDLLAGLFYCGSFSRREAALAQAEQAWSGERNFLVTLSVRSAFDLLLRALRLPPGSEILFSALTVPDMVRIARSHGLVPVPVDLDADGHLSTASLQRGLSPQSRMLVVAHLFGGAVPLADVLAIARERGLLVVEDCAQSFQRVGESANPASDVALFSFGPIKTATALGGAIARVSCSQVRQRMAELLAADPVQSRFSFLRRLFRFAVLKFLSGCFTSALFRRCVQWLGGDFDTLANSLARGFSAADLLAQIRRQPSAPLLWLLRRRWRTYDFDRLHRRMRMGRHLDERLGQQREATHGYWVYPLLVNVPAAVRERLQRVGLDATSQSRMAVVPPPNGSLAAAGAQWILDHFLFLPWYPELPDWVVDDAANLIHTSDLALTPTFDREQIAAGPEKLTAAKFG